MTELRYDPQRKTISRLLAPGFVSEMHIKDFFTRHWVVMQMHYKSPFRDSGAVTNQIWRQVYLMADGFGPGLDLIQAKEIEWDWSHVRDSSPKAFRKMADHLAKMVWAAGDFEAIYTQFLADLKVLGKSGYTPDQYFSADWA